MDITRMRAIEFGKPVIRATNSGVTLAIDAQGQPIKMLPQFEQQVLRVNVAPASGQTPYNRFGSWPLINLGAAGSRHCRLAAAPTARPMISERSHTSSTKPHFWGFFIASFLPIHGIQHPD